MNYGYFDDEKKEYVITRPDTPRSWTNYLGSTEYGAIITNNAGGYSFYRSAAQGRFTRLRFNSIPMDQPGRYLYLRDRDSGDYWSASWQPVGKDLETYRSTCRHGTAYTAIESAYDGIETETTYFVPLGETAECWLCRVTNRGDRPRRLRLFSYVEYASNWSAEQDLINLQFSQYNLKMDVVDDRIIAHRTLPHVPPDPDDFTNNDQGRDSYLALVGAEVSGYDTNREVFIGPYRTYANPAVVEAGGCTGSLAHGDNGCGTLQVDLDLEPGASEDLLFLMGVGRAEEAGRDACRRFDAPGRARAALEELKAHWHGRLGAMTVKTPDDQFNSMVNVWAPYNSLITYAWSRAASLVYSGERDGLGYRDTLQDLLGVLPSIPEEAGERLELMITGQLANGGAMPVVKPFAHHPGREQGPPEEEFRSDDCLWMFNTIPAYVKETGDLAFYEKVLPYADEGEGPVLGHMRRAMEFNLARRGAHGLPCGLAADWNDCLRLGYKGESVFVAFQLRFALATYIDICERLGKEAEQGWAVDQLAELDTALETHTWDGDWFVRAYRDDGSCIGTRNDPEGSIFLNPQSWALLSGFARGERAEQAMQSVEDRLYTDCGLMVCDPPFVETPYHVVRAVLLNAGQKENAGVFNHTQGWAVMAETMLGHGDRAYRYYRSFMPAAFNDRAEIREIEPYVFSQSTHSRYSGQYGASRLPWLTGAATWGTVSASQYLVGVRPDYDGLRVDPCLPSDWPEITVTRHFRGRVFRIRIENGTKGKGVERMTLNGEDIDGSLLPIDRCREENEVSVQLA